MSARGISTTPTLVKARAYYAYSARACASNGQRPCASGAEYRKEVPPQITNVESSLRPSSRRSTGKTESPHIVHVHYIYSRNGRLQSQAIRERPRAAHPFLSCPLRSRNR